MLAGVCMYMYTGTVWVVARLWLDSQHGGHAEAAGRRDISVKASIHDSWPTPRHGVRHAVYRVLEWRQTNHCHHIKELLQVTKLSYY